MKPIKMTHWILGAAIPLLMASTAMAQLRDSPNITLSMDEAKSLVNDLTQIHVPWNGPTTGPKAVPDKLIVYVSTDQRNGGARGAGEGMLEAAKAIGWKARVMDGKGSVSDRATALSQAIAMKADVIVLGAINGQEQASELAEAHKQGIKIIGWHAVVNPGPDESLNIFNNITTDPMLVAKGTAALALVNSDGKAGAVVFTDSTYDIAVYKADIMANIIKNCEGCTLLRYVDTPLESVSSRMPSLTSNLLSSFGDKWTYSLSINDLTFDFMGATLESADIPGDGAPHALSGGDGSDAAFERIRNKRYQMATVAEPLRLQGWQIVDEANRALAGEAPSGFVPLPHLFTAENIEYNGGKNNVYDPDNGYQEHYKKIWGVE